MTIRSQLTFRVKPDSTAEFEATYIGGNVLELARANSGYLGGELLKTRTTPPTYIALARWRSVADYEAWQTSYDTIPQATLDALITTLSEPPQSSVMDILSTASGASTTSVET